MIVLFFNQYVSLLPRSNVFLAGEANFVQAMCRSLERSPQDTRDGFNLYSAHQPRPQGFSLKKWVPAPPIF